MQNTIKKQLATILLVAVFLLLIPLQANAADDDSDDCNNVTVVNCSAYLNIKVCSYNASDSVGNLSIAHTAKTISKGGSNSATFGCDESSCNFSTDTGLLGSCLGDDSFSYGGQSGDLGHATYQSGPVCDTTLYVLTESGYFEGYGLEPGSNEGTRYTWWEWSESGCPSSTGCEESCNQGNL